MRNGNYKIEIGVTINGITLIGAKAVKDAIDIIDDSERVYGIQIGHRVAAKTEKGWEIMTPTQAKNAGYTETRDFPSAR